ncbi:hypothetical protein [Candidatus Similichlamydia epinepheli]|uniref:hypothetical protein n=1 Tax=Candidatus Similichlamydia epinepheli TaxID=1903953 RepID=UPI00130027D5|nr:hypothetical protein [Candidatus Similichlamydia epinepheli]
MFLFEEELLAFSPESWPDLDDVDRSYRFALGIVLHYRSEVLFLQRKASFGEWCTCFELPNGFGYSFETIREAFVRIIESQIVCPLPQIGGFLGMIDYNDHEGRRTRMIWVWAKLENSLPIPLNVSSNFVYGTFVSYSERESFRLFPVCESAVQAFWFGASIGDKLRRLILEEGKSNPPSTFEVILLLRCCRDHAILVNQYEDILELPTLLLAEHDPFLKTIQSTFPGVREELAYLGAIDRWSGSKKQKFFYSFSYDDTVPFEGRLKTSFFISALEGLKNPSSPIARDGFIRFKQRFFVDLYE